MYSILIKRKNSDKIASDYPDKNKFDIVFNLKIFFFEVSQSNSWTPPGYTGGMGGVQELDCDTRMDTTYWNEYNNSSLQLYLIFISKM